MSKRFLSGINVTGTATLNTVANAGLDTDKFLVLDAAGNIDYRTGDELKADIGADVVSKIQHDVKLGESMTIGTPVYVPIAQDSGTNMTVLKASNAGESTSSKTMGLVASSGITNDIVKVVTEGLLEGINTGSATKGDPVWLGENGALIFGLANKPSAPAHLVFLGIVTRAQTNNGEIFVKVQNGFEMDEIHDYSKVGLANNTVITYESATSLYKPKTIPAILGYTPVPDSRTITINGTTYDLSANRSWTITTDASARTILRYVATANQTTFTISGGYTPGLTDVYRNGVKLDNSTDFTATNGTTIILTNGAAVNDVIEVYRYQTAFLANNALRVITEFVATAGQTTFNVTYNTGLVDVFYNGSKLVSTEYTAGNGTSIVLKFACNANDTLEVHAYSYAVGAFSGQAQLNGTGFVKVSGTTVTYDNSTYLTSINSSQVIAALGYTPYNATNPSGYITSSALSSYLPLSGGTLSGSLNIGNFDGQALKLQAGTATGSTYLRFYNSTGGAEGYIGLFNSAGTNYMLFDAGARELSFNSSNKIIFTGGNLGVGTNNPIDKLTVSGRLNLLGLNQNSIWFNQNAGGSNTGFILGRSYATNDAQNFFIYDVASSAFRFNITSTGNIGIGGITDPTNRLQVSGNIYSTDTVFGRNLKPEAWAGPVAGSPTSATIPYGYSTINISSVCDNQWRVLMNNLNDTKGYFWVTLGDAASKDTAQYFMSFTSPAYGVSNFGAVNYQDNGWNTGGFEFTYDTAGPGGTYRLLVRCTSYYNSGNTAYGTIYFLRLE